MEGGRKEERKGEGRGKGVPGQTKKREARGIASFPTKTHKSTPDENQGRWGRRFQGTANHRVDWGGGRLEECGLYRLSPALVV
jgi:hypothetical protein